MASTRAFTEFSEPVLDENWLTDPEPVTTGLDASSFLLTDWALKAVAGGRLLPLWLRSRFDLDDISGFSSALVDNWQEVFTYNWRVCFCVVFGLVMAAVTPLVGGLWCLGRKRGRFGSRSKGWKSSWEDRVQRQLALTFFVVFWSFSLWGVVWHFTSSGLLETGVKNLPQNMDNVVTDGIRSGTVSKRQNVSVLIQFSLGLPTIL